MYKKIYGVIEFWVLILALFFHGIWEKPFISLCVCEFACTMQKSAVPTS